MNPRMVRFWLLSGVIAVSGAISAGCGSGAAKPKGGLTVGMVFDSGGRGDKSFNDSAYRGLKRAQRDFGITIKTVDSRSEKDYEGNISAMADQGCDLVVAVGLNQEDSLNQVAPKYPATRFAIVDGTVDQPNVRSLVFSEEQGSFLAGIVAGMVTKTNTIGFVGGQHIPLIVKFQCGYEAGAHWANPQIMILPPKYTESWNDTAMGRAAASVLYSQGADIVYHAAGRCGLGVIQAAKETGNYAIGVDSDQDYLAPGHVLTSMIKRVDVAVFQTIKDVKDGQFTAGIKRYDLASNGVGLSDFKYTKALIGPKVMKALAVARELIISGKLVVPTTEQALATFDGTVPPYGAK